jgi:hypothetical protein
MRATHASSAGVWRPIGPDVGADQPTARAHHARVEREQYGIVGKPVGVEPGAVIAPDRRTVDQQVAAAVGPDVSHGDGRELLRAPKSTQGLALSRRVSDRSARGAQGEYRTRDVGPNHPARDITLATSLAPHAQTLRFILGAARRAFVVMLSMPPRGLCLRAPSVGHTPTLVSGGASGVRPLAIC